MLITRARLIMGDLAILGALVLLEFVTGNAGKNELAIALVVLLLVFRSGIYHFNYYKANGKIY